MFGRIGGLLPSGPTWRDGSDQFPCWGTPNVESPSWLVSSPERVCRLWSVWVTLWEHRGTEEVGLLSFSRWVLVTPWSAPSQALLSWAPVFRSGAQADPRVGWAGAWCLLLTDLPTPQAHALQGLSFLSIPGFPMDRPPPGFPTRNAQASWSLLEASSSALSLPTSCLADAPVLQLLEVSGVFVIVVVAFFCLCNYFIVILIGWGTEQREEASVSQPFGRKT